jgi:hypothetical protein
MTLSRGSLAPTTAGGGQARGVAGSNRSRRRHQQDRNEPRGAAPAVKQVAAEGQTSGTTTRLMTPIRFLSGPSVGRHDREEARWPAAGALLTKTATTLTTATSSTTTPTPTSAPTRATPTLSRRAKITRNTKRPVILIMLAACCLIMLGASSLGGLVQLGHASMCQYHQAILDNLSVQQSQKPSQQQQQRQQPAAGASSAAGLIVCPKSSQHNNLPQPFHANSKYQNANFERQQRAILKSLNASFANHLQLNGHHAASEGLAAAASGASLEHRIGLIGPLTDASDLIDDELLNEIVPPLIIDDAYQRAKETIAMRRKLENELVRQGECRTNRAAAPDCPNWHTKLTPNTPLDPTRTTTRLRHRHEQADRGGAPPAGHHHDHARQRAREEPGGV